MANRITRGTALIGRVVTRSISLNGATVVAVVPQAAATKPTAGATIDAEARTAIDSIIDKLVAAGVFTTP